MKRHKRAFTLLDVILAIAIFAAVALPLLIVFVQSLKVDALARGVMNANYISQQYIEKLDGTTYLEALSNLPVRQAQGDYWLSASIKPSGGGGGAFIHLLVLSNGKLLAVMPDGTWTQLSSVPSGISLSVSGGRYTLQCDSTSLTGTAGSSVCTIVFNAINMPASVSPGLTLGSGCKALVYCTNDNKDKIRVLSGSAEVFPNIFTGSTSLIHVTTSVYDDPSSLLPVSQTETYVNIRNG